MTNKNTLNSSPQFKAVQIADFKSWVAETSCGSWTGKYYSTERGAKNAAKKANILAGLI